jgi:hypothetical protein
MNILNTLILALIVQLSCAQSNEVYFQYHTNVKAIDTSAEIRQSAQMADNGFMRMYFADSLMRVEQKMGTTGKMIMILDKKANVALTLMDSPMGKFATLRSGDELEFAEVKIDSNAVVKEMNETKKLLGYECRKIMLRSNGEITTYWITDEIDRNLIGEEMVDPNVPGFPMEFSRIQGGMELSYTISNIQFELEDKETLFSTTPPEGYQIMPTSR